jgi:hypothetical protein
MALIRGDWRNREFDERLRKQFEERGFYLLNDGHVRHAPLPAGFNNTERTEKYLEELQAEYRYVAYKSMEASTGIGSRNERVVGNIFIKVGSLSREPYPIVELTAWYGGRMYKYVAECHHFNDRMMNARDVNDVADAVKILFDYANDVINTWQRSVRTLILENRWPEGDYISDVKFMED